MISLADEVLALHSGIHEVFVLEERAGNHVVVGEASRNGLTLLADSIDRAAKHGIFAPMLIFGAATQFSGMETKLVGVAQEKAGFVFAAFDENKALALSTSPESLHEVMQLTSESFPRLNELARELHMQSAMKASAVKAEEIARLFLAGKLPLSARVRVDEVAYRDEDQRWGVYGSCQPQPWTISKRFQVEVDSNDGSVKRFVYSSSSRLLFIEFACLVAAGLLALLVFVLWR